MVESFDTIIVGSSLAGSSLALRLGNSGERVALIDKQQFPRSKACGEGLSRYGVELLAELGVDITQLPYVPLKRFRLISRSKSVVIMQGRASGGGCEAPVGKDASSVGVGVSRTSLDDLVLSNAADCPFVRNYPGCRVVFFNSNGSYCAVELDDGQIVYGQRLVLAVGGRSPLLKMTKVRGVQKRFGYSFHLEADRDLALAEVQIHLNSGFEVYLTPVDKRRVNVALLSSGKRFREIISPRCISEIVVRLEHDLCCKLTLSGDVHATGPFGNVQRRSLYPNVYLVGDAVEQFDPVGGMGMTHALISSKVLAEEIVSGKQLALAEATIQRRYARRRWNRTKLLRGFTRLSYLALVRFGDYRAVELLRSMPVARGISNSVLAMGRATVDSGFIVRAVVGCVGLF